MAETGSIRIALIEAGHWHAPLYLDGLSGDGIDVVAVSDREGAGGRQIAERCKARFHEDWRALIQSEAIDFAIAFGRPVEMPAIGEALVEAGIAFALEKPCGVDPAGVRRLAEMAARAGHFAAVPYLYRIGPLRTMLANLSGGLPGRFHHLSFRFIGGPPTRYLENDCAWMLDPTQSGGGALMNLGGHFVDLFHLLTGGPAATVSALTSEGAYGAGVEDYAVLRLTGAGGAIGVIEAGYTFPSAGEALREFSFTLRSEQYYVTSRGRGLEVRSVAAPQEKSDALDLELRNELYYPMFVADTIERFRAGKPPACGLEQAVEVMDIMALAYRSAASGGQVLAYQ